MAVRLTDKILPLNDAFVGMVDAAQIVETPAGFKDEDDMASNSATAFCSQQSIKKYVDDEVLKVEGTEIKSTGEAGGTKYLREDGDGTCSWQAVSAGTVDVVSNVATSTILGRVTAGSGDSEELTATQVRTLINVEDGADVTDTANVTAAGALMDSEVDADIKTLSLPASTTISTFGASLVDDADAATARATLGITTVLETFKGSLENPVATDEFTLGFTNRAITITEIRAVLVGSSTPSVTWTIRHSTDRSATGNEVVTSGTTTTSTTTGSDVTSFNDATIPADSFIWLEVSAQSGTVTELSVTAIASID